MLPEDEFMFDIAASILTAIAILTISFGLGLALDMLGDWIAALVTR